jgi:SAM-dependent methyltransferase
VVVDVGCGAQPYRTLVGPRATYLGIDTADAKARFGYEIPDTTYFTGDRWPLEDASVDLVLCTETIEHVPNTSGFVSEIARVLRPGGELILTVPFSARYHFIPHDYWRFTPAGLKQILSPPHFDDVAVYARGNAVTVACYKTMALALPLLFISTRSVLLRYVSRAVGLAFSPVFLLLAAIANVSVQGRGGDDCLGYTVLARRSGVANPADSLVDR